MFILFVVVYYAALRNVNNEDKTQISAVPTTPTKSNGEPIKLPASAGETLELCAGIIDKSGRSLEEIAAEEVYEECGYKVLPEKLEKISAVW